MSAPRLSGRFDLDDPAGPRFAWSGTAIHARFAGSTLDVRLRGAGDFFAVEVDGVARPPFALEAGRESYPLAAGLPHGEHEVVVTKRTEPLVGEAQLLGFDPGPGGRLLPPPPAPARRLELVGDSITAGFGVLGRDASCPFSPDTEDFGSTYGALAARALGAEAAVVAWSGRGACRNWADEPGDHVPALWERTLPARVDSRWDFGRFAPDVVVVNLGTNDFSLGALPTEPFTAAYAAFVARIVATYARAQVVCCLGPMLEGAALAAARGCLERVAAGAGPRVHLLEFPTHTAADGFGCDGHPSAATHRRMAAQLTDAIRALAGW